MPRSEGDDRELTEEELETVVGGSKDMKVLFKNWRGYIKEDVDLKVGTFFEHPHQNLNESLWDENDQLKPEVAEKLLEIARQFISKTQGADAEIKDITFTGSLANYNYSMLSDIDLHILIDFEELNDDVDLVKDYFSAVKALWNYLHDIRIKSYEVEVYVQDAGLVGPPESGKVREEHISSGVYSIMNNEWIKRPEYKKAKIDSESITNKAESLMDQIDRALALMEKDKHKEAHDRAIKIRNKIKKFRQAGLETAGEYSIENLAFKTLRNNGYLGKLSTLKRDAYDKMMSLNEIDISSLASKAAKHFTDTASSISDLTKTAAKGAFDIGKFVVTNLPPPVPSGPSGPADFLTMAAGGEPEGVAKWTPTPGSAAQKILEPTVEPGGIPAVPELAEPDPHVPKDVDEDLASETLTLDQDNKDKVRNLRIKIDSKAKKSNKKLSEKNK